MIAPALLPDDYAAWNRKHGAPFGHRVDWLPAIVPWRFRMRLGGPFSIQPNNTTRAFEYPWAFHAASLRPGMTVLEIGGGLSGFQFVLSRHGCKVVNVDPGQQAASHGWRCDQGSMRMLNRMFGTDVELRNTLVADASLGNESVDLAVSISVLEHLPDEALESVMTHVHRALRPGGRFVVTTDLFIDIAPFTARPANKYGRNVDVRRMIAMAPFKMESGVTSELHGFPDFDAGVIQSRLSDFLIGNYPALTQCLVLVKQ